MRIALMAALVVAPGIAALAQTVTPPPPKEPAGPTAVAPQPKRMAPKSETAVAREGKAPNQEYTDCLSLWDAKTHMTREQWSVTCKRVQSRLNTMK